MKLNQFILVFKSTGEHIVARDVEEAYHYIIVESIGWGDISNYKLYEKEVVLEESDLIQIDSEVSERWKEIHK